MSTRLTRSIALAAATTLVALTPLAAANAAVAGQRDKHGDAPIRFDITRAVVNNGEKRVTVRIKVKDLRRGPASFSFFLAPADTYDFGYLAKATRKRDGSVVTRLDYTASHTTMERVRCKVNARWVLAKDLVRISYPQACMGDFVGGADVAAYSARAGKNRPFLDETKWFSVAYN